MRGSSFSLTIPPTIVIPVDLLMKRLGFMTDVLMISGFLPIDILRGKLNSKFSTNSYSVSFSTVTMKPNYSIGAESSDPLIRSNFMKRAKSTAA